MKFNYFKLVVIALLGSFLVVYTNCGQPFGAPSTLVFESNFYGAPSEVSLNAFKSTVYPITRSYCVSCHSVQEPLHASDDVTEAHKAVIQGAKVNFSNIPASRLVAKLRDTNHNCWSDCAENAAEMQTAIEKWNDIVKAAGGGEQAPVDVALYTEESMPLEQEFMDQTNSANSNTVKLNIEAAMLRAPMVLTRPAGEEAYLSVPNNGANATLANNDVNAGSATFNFQVPATATNYRVWAYVHGPADADNSFHVNVRNTQTNATVSGGFRQFEYGVNTKLNWILVNAVPNMSLTRNTMYSVEVRQREDGARLGGIVITADAAFNGSEIGDFLGITLSYDLSPILKTPSTFLIDVIEYDPYSYKFSKPRIVAGTSSVYVKGVKLHLNGHYGPQQSTYALVDKIITPQDQSLSTYSMVILKDKGMVGDQIKFSFDQLLITTDTTNGSAGGGANGGTTGQTSLMAFQQTVYPISRSSAYSCVGCHMNVSPRHASDNTLTAHDAALSVVDFNNPGNSRIVTKLRVDRHNCGANCDQIATQYQNAIQEWQNRRQ